jgi:two-component system sensor histidine kinase KdpD
LTATAEGPARRPMVPWVLWSAVLALVTALLIQARTSLGAAHIVLAYLVLVLGASARGGRVLGLSLALVAFACFNFFFVPPYHTLAVADPLDWSVLGAFLVTSGVAAELLATAQRQAAEARRRAADVDRLAAVGAEALNANRAEDALAAIANVVRLSLDVARCEIHLLTAGADVTLAASSGLLPVSPGLPHPVDRPLGLPDTSRLVAWVAEHGRPAAVRADGTWRLSDTDTEAREAVNEAGTSDRPVFEVPDARVLLFPLRVRGRAVGVLTLQHDGAIAFDDGARRLLAALAYYAALGAERVRLSTAAEHADALREADRLKDALLMSVSHDLRTPLTTIKALAHAIASDGDERAVTIEEEADRLNRFVGDLLDLSRLAGGALTVSPEINAAEDLLGVALERVSGAAGARTISVRLDAGEPLLLGRFDFTHALRVLVNLIENAIKYAPDDTPIEVSAHRAGPLREFLEFSVSDRGPGVPDAERARIFEPFYRRAGSAPDAGSAGVGLAIARQLAEAQGGTLDIAPRSGGGSCFTLRVPAVDVAETGELVPAPRADSCASAASESL